MNIWMTLLLVVQVLAALGIIVLVLLQHGKGADMGAAFGSGSSGSLFGATGSANFLSRTTAVLAAVFFLVTLALAFVATDRPDVGGDLQNLPQRNLPQQSAPAAPAPIPGEATKDQPTQSAPAPAADPAKAGEIPK